jgi:hypothetical protein
MRLSTTAFPLDLWPTPPGPADGFNNFESAQDQANRWAGYQNARNRTHMTTSVIPYYIERGARKPYDTGGTYTRHQYRNQPFPVSAPKVIGKVVAMSQVPGFGTSGFQPVVEALVNPDTGKLTRQFSQFDLLNLCQTEFETQTGLPDHFTTRVKQEVLEAAGMTVVVPQVPLSEAFGIELDQGMWSFSGNRLQAPADGTRAVNPNDGQEYVFYNQGGSQSQLRIWLSPAIYQDWRG